MSDLASKNVLPFVYNKRNKPLNAFKVFKYGLNSNIRITRN